MHQEVWEYCSMALSRIEGVKGKRILEIGSRNVNGSVRFLCKEALEYVGIDPWPGQDVDIITTAAAYYPEHQFDVVFCTEVLQYMERPSEAIDCAWRALVPGGVVIITAAGPARQHLSGEGPYWSTLNTKELSKLLSNWQLLDVTDSPESGGLTQDPSGRPSSRLENRIHRPVGLDVRALARKSREMCGSRTTATRDPSCGTPWRQASPRTPGRVVDSPVPMFF